MNEQRIIIKMRPEGDSRYLPAMPSRMLGRVLDLLRHKFSNPDNAFRPELRDVIYTEDYETTGIIIAQGFDGHGESDKPDVFPRAIVSPAGFKVSQETSPITDDFLTNATETDDLWINRYPMFTSFAGSTLISVASRVGLESLILAEDILLWLLMLKEDTRKKMCLSKFDVTLLEGPKKHDGTPSCYITGVQVDWASGVKWDVVPEGIPIGDLSINT